MKIDKNLNGSELTIKLEGRLDTITSSGLEKELGDLNEINSIVFDFKNLDYISSAGLRVLLSCQKKMKILGTMVIKNVKSEIKDVFDMTGFSDILTII